MPKKVDHEKRRETFARAAISVIAERGLDAVRLVDVARAVGVTTGSLTHYFSDKDQLIAAALDEVISRSLARTDASAGSLSDMLATFLPLDAEGQKASRVWLAFFARALGNETLSDIHRQYYAEFHDRLVERLAREPQLPAERRPMAADMIIALVDGILVRATLDPDDWPAAKQLEHLELALSPLLGRSVKRHEEETS